MTESARRPDEQLLDELTDQLGRTRRLLTGKPDEAVESALSSFGGEAEVEARIAAGLAVASPLARPEVFLDAHRLALRGLEVLDDEGSSGARLPRLGPLRPAAAFLVHYIAWFIVRAYQGAILWRLRALYTKREAQARPGSTERHLLARARLDTERLTPSYGGGGLTRLLLGGAAISALGWLPSFIGALGLREVRIHLEGVGILLGFGLLFALFFSISWVLLRGAAIAHRRCRLVMERPLAALWESIGHAGVPPRDSGRTYATVAIGIAAIVWFVIPALALLLFFL